MEEQYKIRINGKVQGVFFRASTRRKALEIGLKGFVRNMENGDVYVEARGSKEQLNLLVEWCHEGPEHAHVNRVDLEVCAPADFRGFEILY